MPRFIIEKPVYFRIPITASDPDTARAQADGIVDAAAKLINFVVLDEDAEPDVYLCESGRLYEVDAAGAAILLVGEQCDD